VGRILGILQRLLSTEKTKINPMARTEARKYQKVKHAKNGLT
jgi:hypothetical protein